MTVIVYQHATQQIAVDSRVTAGDLIVSDECNKEEFRQGDIWFSMGSVADSKIMLDIFYSDGEASRDIDGTGALMVNNGTATLVGVENGKIWHHPVSVNRCLGSGGEFALASLDHGKTAKQAAEYACTRNNGCGGKIRVFDIATAKFIEEG